MADPLAAYGLRAEGSLEPDALFAGEFPRVMDAGTLISGQNLARGAVLGRITASGKLNLSLSAAGDGSNTPVAILAADCDASGGDKPCIFYLSGEFNAAKLTFGTAHTAASTKHGLAARSIFLKNATPA